MKVLVLYAHPHEGSYVAGLHEAVVRTLTEAGHTVDDCDLYAEDFQPVLTRSERLNYHKTDINFLPVEGYVARVRAAEAIVIVSPVWNFGFPAILKGFLDRVFLPGVTFRLENGKVVSEIQHIRTIISVMTYGATRWRAFLAGDPPRKMVTRVLRAMIGWSSPTPFLAHYDMNRSTPASREAFLAEVVAQMRKL
jgi:NAD(P)H dehydrogenase (quinone)